MKKYRIVTHDRNGKPKAMKWSIDMTTPEFIHHVKTQLVGKCYGNTTVCRLFNNGKQGKQYSVF